MLDTLFALDNKYIESQFLSLRLLKNSTQSDIVLTLCKVIEVNVGLFSST